MFETLENHILATNHIIVCGVEQNLINLILPLRNKNIN
jgi:hypothetical protein